MNLHVSASTRPRVERTMTPLMSACVVVVVAMVAAVNLALPALAGSGLRPSSTGLLWIVDAYILLFGCLLLPAGALADRSGRTRVLLAGLAIFVVGCLGSAVAPSVTLLVVTRGVTGVGAALVMPASLSLLLQVTPDQGKPRAIATWSAATGAAGAVGNVGGGLILQWFAWRALFLAAASAAAILGVLVHRLAPAGERRPTTTDVVGAVLATASVFLLLFGIIGGPEHGWRSPVVLTAFVGAIGSGLVLVRHSLRTEHPMLDPRLFRIPAVRRGTLGVAAVFFGLFALFFVNAQYLQYAKGYTPLGTGVAILPLPIGMIVVSRRSSQLGRRLGARRVVSGGLVLLAAGLVGLSLLRPSTPYVPYAVALAVVAVGMGMSVPMLSTGIVQALPAAHSGVGSGLNSAAREVGAALGVATVGTVVASVFGGSLPDGLVAGESIHATLATAERIGPGARQDAVRAFTDAMASGLRVVALVVLVAALLVAGRSPGRSGS